MKNGLEKSFKHVYFVGIGGISMSGLAEILLSRGLNISGSDIKKSDITKRLVSLGADIHTGHSAENIKDGIDLVVYTAAVKNDNPELAAAREKGIPLMDRAELLGHIMFEYNSSIAVSGTHGKTTTTSMLSEILLGADKDPTISVGGILPAIGGNTRVGGSGYFVAEACEYFDSFLKFNPHIAVILNIEADHLDYFKNIENIRKSFSAFAARVDKSGLLVINKDIERVGDITEGLDCNVETFSLNDPNANWRPENIVHNQDGSTGFDVIYNNVPFAQLTLCVPGEHNIKNALASCAAANGLNISPELIKAGLGAYRGANRRFQHKGEFNGVRVVDDYAHHPTEIRATLEAAKNVRHNKLWCVFQPHTYSRTYTLLKDFAAAFSSADNIIIADIYAAREKDTGLINSKVLADSIKANGDNAIYIGNFAEIENYLTNNCKPGDLLITMGAGDVYTLGESLVSQ